MRKFGIGTAFAMAGCVALGAGALALATDDGTSSVTQVAEEGGSGGQQWGPPPGAGVGPPGQFRGHPGFRGRGGFGPPSGAGIREHRDQFIKDLAAELDKTPQEIETALQHVFKKHIDEAVKDGDLTQKQADRILKCRDTGKCGPPGAPPFGR